MLDIVVVVGAGPKGMHTGIGVDPSMYKSRLARGSLSPQRYGRTNNRLITTSSTDTDGGISNFASNIGPALDDTARIVDETLTGSDDVFTLGVRLTLPEGARAEAPTRRVIASAYSAAQIGGLAAYFMGIQRWNAIYMPGQTAWEVKKLIVGLKRRAPRSPDGHGLAYNGVHDAQCPVLPLFGIPSDPNGGPPNVQQYIPPPPPFPHPHPPIRHLVDLPSSANLTIVGDLSGGQNSSLVRRSSEISKPTVLYKNGHWDPKYHHLAESVSTLHLTQFHFCRGSWKTFFEVHQKLTSLHGTSLNAPRSPKITRSSASAMGRVAAKRSATGKQPDSYMMMATKQSTFSAITFTQIGLIMKMRCQSAIPGAKVSQ